MQWSVLCASDRCGRRKEQLRLGTRLGFPICFSGSGFPFSLFVQRLRHEAAVRCQNLSQLLCLLSSCTRIGTLLIQSRRVLSREIDRQAAAVRVRGGSGDELSCCFTLSHLLLSPAKTVTSPRKPANVYLVTLYMRQRSVPPLFQYLLE